ncbi:MAG: ABC-F family ATP-binding cassette domain-containing protein, partial [Clostridiaceae bacterium]
MIALSGSQIKKEYGTDVILSGISFSVNDGDKVALIGANGVGKSTLFKILTGEISHDEGDFFIERNKTLGYLSQNLSLEGVNSIYEEVLTVFKELTDMRATLRSLEDKMAEPYEESNKKWHDELILEYTTLQDLYILRGGMTYIGEMQRVMTGLGLTSDTWEKKISYLSGGEKTRVALSKLLLRKPDILLLDEPTNHLDLSAVEWLEEFLKGYKGTLLVISHDRFFLDNVTNRTFLLLKGEMLCYNAPYTKYLELYKKDYEVRLKAYELQQDEIKRQEAIIEKYRSFNREKSIKAAESRQKRLDKMELINKPKKMGRAAKISFKASFESGNDVLIAEELSKTFGEKKLFQNLDFMIKKGEKIALIGENGRGKTTLFNIVRGRVKPDIGRTILGRNVQIGYYDQEQADLDPDKTVMDEVWDDFPHLTTTELRNSLGAYLFKGDDVFKEIRLLSGGEKCRINLLKLMLREDNFLLLDEPTNHLDIPSREALEDSLKDYDGTMFVISHDRYFLNKVVNKIFELREAGITQYLG